MANNLIPKGSNPAFNPNLFDGQAIADGNIMTVNGTIGKVAISLLIAFVSAGFTWSTLAKGFTDAAQIYTAISFIVALILGFVIIFMRTSPAIRVLVPIYAAAEGMLLGNISYLANSIYPGIAQNAVNATFLCLAVMLVLYRLEIIRVTEKFRAVMMCSLITIFGIYLINLILSFFQIQVPFLYSSSPIGIGFSFIVVAILSFNLLLDFDFIDNAARSFWPKHVEWYGAFGLLLSVIWLYIEILNLLMKLQRRN